MLVAVAVGELGDLFGGDVDYEDVQAGVVVVRIDALGCGGLVEVAGDNVGVAVCALLGTGGGGDVGDLFAVGGPGDVVAGAGEGGVGAGHGGEEGAGSAELGDA